MSRPESEHPTDLELDILKVLWNESPLPVREVRARLESDIGRTLAHSSVITILNIMHRKGLVKRTKDGNAFLFTPRYERNHVTGGMVRTLLTKAFEGSPSALMQNLLAITELDAEELDELKQLISRKAKEQKP